MGQTRYAEKRLEWFVCPIIGPLDGGLQSGYFIFVLKLAAMLYEMGDASEPCGNKMVLTVDE
jgi:hypothetical protein